MKLYSKEDDPFLNDDNAVKRLLLEWNEYKTLVIAFDYDNTVFDYYNEEVEFPKIIELLKNCKKLGAHVICFTSCHEERYPEIKAYLAEKQIPYDSINETPDFIPFKEGRKVYYNILLDDRAGLASAYRTLNSAYTLRRIGLRNEKAGNSQDIDF